MNVFLERMWLIFSVSWSFLGSAFCLLGAPGILGGSSGLPLEILWESSGSPLGVRGSSRDPWRSRGAVRGCPLGVPWGSRGDPLRVFWGCPTQGVPGGSPGGPHGIPQWSGTNPVPGPKKFQKCATVVKDSRRHILFRRRPATDSEPDTNPF